VGLLFVVLGQFSPVTISIFAELFSMLPAVMQLFA
jgi:hypothetical protein